MKRSPASGGPFSQSCSWCHTMNVVGSIVRGVVIKSPTPCRECGHRADVCRLECDCAKCRTPPKPLSPDDLAAAFERLNAGRISDEARRAEARRLMAGYLEPKPEGGAT